MSTLTKRTLARLAASAPVLQLVRTLERFAHNEPGQLIVLTYHRIGDPEQEPDADPALFSATAEVFEQHLDLIARQYRPVSAAEVLAALDEPRRLPPKAVLITFDDAYRDFAALAWPLLKAYGVPASLFVPTAYPDAPERSFWWDQLTRVIGQSPQEMELELPWGPVRLGARASREDLLRRLKEHLKSLPHRDAIRWVEQITARCSSAQPAVEQRSPNKTLGWAELRRLADEGVTLGAHTRTHPLLNRVDRQQLEEEISGSLADLRRELGTVLPIFAYPAGAVSEDAREILQQAGCRLAFTTRTGINQLAEHDPLRLDRIHIGRATSVNVLRARLVREQLRFNRRPRGNVVNEPAGALR